MTINSILEVEDARQTADLAVSRANGYLYDLPTEGVDVCPGCGEPIQETGIGGGIKTASCNCTIAPVWYARKMLMASLLDSVQRLDETSGTALFQWLISIRKPPKAFKLLNPSPSQHGIRASVAYTAYRDRPYLDRCTDHWLTFCPKAECALCQQEKEVEKSGTVKIKNVSRWQWREITPAERRCSSDSYEPEYGTLEQYEIQSLQTKKEIRIYPSQTESAALADYPLRESALGTSLSYVPTFSKFARRIYLSENSRWLDGWDYVRLGEDRPSRWIPGDGYTDVVTVQTYFDAEYSHKLRAPKGTSFIGGPEASRENRSVVWKYPQSFLEPRSVSERSVATVLEEKRVFLRALRKIRINTRAAVEIRHANRLARKLNAEEWPSRTFRANRVGQIQMKVGTAADWKTLADPSTVPDDLAGPPAHFQSHPFEHLSADDRLGGGPVAAKSQSAQYNFRIFEETAFPHIFSSKKLKRIACEELNSQGIDWRFASRADCAPTLSEIEWPDMPRPALYMEPTPYWPTIPKIQPPDSKWLCNHNFLNLKEAHTYCTVCRPKLFPLYCAGRHFDGPIKGPLSGCANKSCVKGNRCKKCSELERKIAPKIRHEPGCFDIQEYALSEMVQPEKIDGNCGRSICPQDNLIPKDLDDIGVGKPLVENATRDEIKYWQRKADQLLQKEYGEARDEWALILGEDKLGVPETRESCRQCLALMSISDSGAWYCGDCDVFTKESKPIEEGADEDESPSEPIDKQPEVPSRQNEVVPTMHGSSDAEASFFEQLPEYVDSNVYDFEEAQADVSYLGSNGRKHLRPGFQEKKSRRGRKGLISWTSVVRILREFYPEWQMSGTPNHKSYDRRYRRLHFRYELGLTNSDIARHERAVCGISSSESAVEKDISSFEKEARRVLNVRPGGWFDFREVAKIFEISQSDLLTMIKPGRVTAIKTETSLAFNLKQVELLAKKLKKAPLRVTRSGNRSWSGTAHLLSGLGESAYSRQSVRSVGVPPIESYSADSEMLAGFALRVRRDIRGTAVPGPQEVLPESNCKSTKPFKF